MSNKLNNFTNIRVQGVSHEKFYSHLKHNLRHIPTRSSTNNNENLFMNKLNHNTITYASGSKSEVSKMMYDGLSQRYREDRREHNIFFKENNKRNLRTSQGSWAEGILTFSEQLRVDYASGAITEKQLLDAATEMLKEFEKEWETKIELVTLHLDEKTPHFHFMFKNFDELGNSITHKNRDKETLSLLQDLMFKHFEPLGMERGIKKTTSGFDHKKTRIDITINHQLKIISDNNLTIDNILKEQSELRSENSDITLEIVSLKSQRKEIQADVLLGKTEKKNLYSDISAKQKTLREEYKINNAKTKELSSKIKEIKSAQAELQNKINAYDKAMSMLPEDMRDMVDNYQQIIDRNELLEDYVEDRGLTEDLNEYEDSINQGFSNEALSILDFENNKSEANLKR